MLKLVLALLAGVTLTSAAHAHDRRAPRGPVVYAPDPIQGVGCYWARQRYICARYCFWQPDGRRYCVDRERHARREVVAPAPLPYVIEKPMK